jgi:hypothetical protein
LVGADPRGVQRREVGERELPHHGASRAHAAHALGGPVVPRVAVGADRCVGEKGMDTEGLERICVYNVTLALSIDDLLKRPKQLMCKPYGHPIVGSWRWRQR